MPALLLQISASLIRAPRQRLEAAIDDALARVTQALGADRAVIAHHEPGGFVEHRVWDRSLGSGRTRRVGDDDAPWILKRLALGGAMVYSRRDELPPEAPRVEHRPLHLAAGIFVPLEVGGSITGVLGITARMPRRWTPHAIDATHRLGEMVAAALERMASKDAVTREQGERRHAENETRKLRDQLAHAGRVTMLGELAASLAHELNQPLTAIYSNAQAALRFIAPPRPDLAETRGALSDLAQDCRRATGVVRRLHQMFRRKDTERLPLDVSALIAQVVELLHEDAVGRSLNVTVDAGHDLALVSGDRIQLEQVVMNLLVNAFEAVNGSPGPREVTVRVRTSGSHVVVSVLDTGPGIASEDLDRIFEPFFSSKPNGMGMGLPICRSIVEAHGGRIAGGNAPERGSVFEFNLPAIVSVPGGRGHE